MTLTSLAMLREECFAEIHANLMSVITWDTEEARRTERNADNAATVRQTLIEDGVLIRLLPLRARRALTEMVEDAGWFKGHDPRENKRHWQAKDAYDVAATIEYRPELLAGMRTADPTGIGSAANLNTDSNSLPNGSADFNGEAA